MISVGDKLPEATLLQKIDGKGTEVSLSGRLAGRKIALFAVPGAFTPTCSSAHLPSFIRVADQLRAKGVDEIICLSVNDAHVMEVWGEQSGGIDAGITFLADADGAFTKAIGLDFTAPAVGMLGRSKRYSMLIDDGVVSIFNPETGSVCEISGGENMLDQL